MSLVKHYYGYLEEFITLTHDVYSKSPPAVFCTYYSLDIPNSIWDENYVASYQDIGVLSGRRFNKISLVPTFFGEGAPPSLVGNEKGTTRVESIRPTIVIPRTSYFEPKLGEYVLFTNLNGETLLYETINLDYTMPNNRAAFKLQLTAAHHEIADLEAVVSNRYIYNDYLDIVNAETVGIPLLSITEAIPKIDEYIRNTFFFRPLDCVMDNNVVSLELNYYLQKNSDEFPVQKKTPFFNLAQPDYQSYEVNSMFSLLFESAFTSGSYDVSMTSYPEEDMSDTFFNRYKPLVGISVYKGGTGASFINGLAAWYTGSDLVEAEAAVAQFFSFRQGTGYTPSTSAVPLAQIINDTVAFEAGVTIPAGYTQRSGNLLEAVMEFGFFRKVCDYAIANKVTGL